MLGRFARLLVPLPAPLLSPVLLLFLLSDASWACSVHHSRLTTQYSSEP